MHLLDTMVVWELRDAKAERGDAAVARWAASQPRMSLFVSALTLAELGRAALLAERRDKPGAAAMRRWIDGPVAAAFEGRVLPVDAPVAGRAGVLAYANVRDALIAATALEHGLTLATRNTAAFRAAKVRTFSPWGYEAAVEEDDSDWRQAARGGQWLKGLFVRG